MQEASQNTFQSHGKPSLDLILVLGRASDLCSTQWYIVQEPLFIKHMILKRLVKF